MILIATIFVLVTGGVPGWRAEPITDGSDIGSFADPLPQAFVLTAIVITLAVTILMLAMAVIGRDDMLSRHPETGESRQA